jgi:hypothetical protein
MHMIDPKPGTDEIWDQFKAVWRFAEKVCPVQYSPDLPPGVGAGYIMRDNKILIGNKLIRPGQDVPKWGDKYTMMIDACMVMHELSHAYSFIEGGREFEKYRRSLALWNYVNMDGSIILDDDRKRILNEEVRVELRGIKMIRSVAPDFEEAYSVMMMSNLTSYTSLLWTGQWPNGTPQRWEGPGTSPMMKF